MDAAILRRLEKRILVDLPNIDAREAMIKHYLPPMVIEKPALLCKLDYMLLAKVRVTHYLLSAMNLFYFINNGKLHMQQFT